MAKVITVGGLQVWSLDASVGRGSYNRLIDVQLVQYLMVFFFVNTPNENKYTLAEVDGKWGPRSQNFLDNIQNLNSGTLSVDGRADPFPLGYSDNSPEYMISMLQKSYATSFGGGSSLLSACSATLMSLPGDGVCPPQLSDALSTAQAAFRSSSNSASVEVAPGASDATGTTSF